MVKILKQDTCSETDTYYNNLCWILLPEIPSKINVVAQFPAKNTEISLTKLHPESLVTKSS